MDVFIAGYAGVEKNIMFARTADGLSHQETACVRSGEVLSLGPDAIHAVTAEGDAPCLSLHVYMGPLTRIKRDLFDWKTGERLDFTEERFEAMKLSDEEMEERY